MVAWSCSTRYLMHSLTALTRREIPYLRALTYHCLLSIYHTPVEMNMTGTTATSLPLTWSTSMPVNLHQNKKHIIISFLFMYLNAILFFHGKEDNLKVYWKPRWSKSSSWLQKVKITSAGTSKQNHFINLEGYHVPARIITDKLVALISNQIFLPKLSSDGWGGTWWTDVTAQH